MEEYLEKKIYVYRRSYNDYHKISISLTVGKFLFTASGLSAFVMVPLAALSLGAGVIEVIDKSMKLSERKEEYKQAYKFYKQLLNLFKAESISEADAYLREEQFTKNLQYFPLEKYTKKAKLNGYNFV